MPTNTETKMFALKAQLKLAQNSRTSVTYMEIRELKMILTMKNIFLILFLNGFEF